jgi:hypothetical protein
MLKAFAEKVLDLARVEYLEKADGRQYASKEMKPIREPLLPVLGLNTLKGLVDYLKSGFDGDPKVALHILSAKEVVAFLPISGPRKDRDCVVAVNWGRKIFSFGAWLDQENFSIGMQAAFVRDKDWQTVVDVASKIVCEDKAELMDNGISQAVTVSRGVRKENGVILPNPVVLRPVRTFTEVEQPESPFVFRMRSDPVALSLHEADMGAWEIVAKENIKAYLEAELPGIPVFI